MTSILIIYTGGTIGMVESEDGKTLVPFNLDHILASVPELNKLDVELASVSIKQPIDSSDIQPENWTELAQIIASNYESHDGFVILHGSDTLAYTASALSYMLDGLKKPVVLTGSQLPIGKIRTDARENIITAVEVAAAKLNEEPIIQEVAIYFEDMLYRGNRTKKLSTEAFEAFFSPNYPVLAEAGVNLNYDMDELFRTKASKFSVVDGFNTQVAVLTLFPGISEEMVTQVLTNTTLRGLVLMTFGAGNAPTKKWLNELLKTQIERGLVVVNVTQCAMGTVEHGKYATSHGLRDACVVCGADLTLEAAITKLMFLLGQYEDPVEVKAQMSINLRGELTK